MTDFLIKSTVVLSVLLGAYYLLLEKEKFHQFNRFFLLGSLLISFIIPFVTIEMIKEISVAATGNVVVPGNITTQIVEDKTPIYSVVGWIIYGLVTMLLFFRFVNNLYKLIRKSRIDTVMKFQNARLVLLEEETLPYTFFNTIFINEKDYHDKKIEAELFTHELIHVSQRHSLDILLIEVIKIAFWFNPIFIFYKKAIQLNHEFLADEKVVKSHKNVSFYQHLLLSKANQSPVYYLVSNLNYSVTKKRLIMMTATTSAKMAFFKKISLVPVLVFLVLFLCVKTVAQEIKGEPKKEISKNITAGEKQQFEKSLGKNDSIGSETRENIKNSSAEKTDNLSKKDTIHSSASTVKSVAEVPIVDPVETKPEYPGGILEFYKFIGKNFKMPAEAEKNKIQGKVYLQFIIEKEGSLSEFKIVKDAGYGIGDEIIRVLKLSPNWIPGTQEGKPVRVMYSLPVTVQPDK